MIKSEKTVEKLSFLQNGNFGGENMKIEVVSENFIKTVTCEKGENLLSVLQRNGYNIAARCGGNGTCGKCKVKVLSGRFGGQSGDVILSCRAVTEQDARIEVSECEGGGLFLARASDFVSDGEEGFGVALDIGTTTLAFALVDLKTGEEINACGELNRQGVFGADVISRIASADNGNLTAMQKSVLTQTENKLREFSGKYCIERIRRLAVCGNTTMLNIFLGKDISGIGRFPFTAEVLDSVTLHGKDLGLSVDEIVVLPSVAAYFGADAVVGGLASDVCGGERIFADIGTNGEILLHTKGKLWAASTAAGPCFEGANIECGTGGVAGAIGSVYEDRGELQINVLGGGSASGICGSGLVDAVSLMLEKKIIDETGTFSEGDRFYLTESVYVSQKDIRAFQLAKSAICSGIRVLAKKAEILPENTEKLFIAGGLGFYLDRKNAVNTGLIPSEYGDKIEVVGNTALAGAKMCLVSTAARQAAKEFAKKISYVELSDEVAFSEEFMSNMGFGD